MPRRVDHTATLLFIKKATRYDIEKVYFIEQQTFSQDKFSKAQIIRAVKNDYGLWMAMQDKPVGYYYYTLERYYIRLYSIAVVPSCQRQGIGRILLQHFHDLIDPYLYPNHKGLRLECRRDNTRAINFYKKHGYREYGMKHNYYQDGMSAVLLRRLWTGRQCDK